MNLIRKFAAKYRLMFSRKNTNNENPIEQQPKVQKPTVEDIENMLTFFCELDEEIANNFSTGYITDWDKFEDYFNENLAGSYTIVLMALLYLLENVTDQNLDYLEFNPIIKQVVGNMNSGEIQEKDK